MSTSAKLRVLIVEDDVLVSMFLADLVEDADFDLVGVARTAAEALALAQEHRPDIALMDANLKGGVSGVSAAGSGRAVMGRDCTRKNLPPERAHSMSCGAPK